MCRTGMCRFGLRNWIFLVAALHLFTYVQGGEDQDEGIRFTSEPSDAVVLAGGSTVLSCGALTRRGHLGSLRIAWRHSKMAPTREHTVSTNDKYRKQLSNGSLLIEDMSPSTTGQYQCVASVDGVGTIVSRIATVFLAELPEVVGGSQSVLGVAGGPVLLPCGIRAPPRLAVLVLTAAGLPERRVYGAAKAQPPPPTLKLNVTWLKNGSPVRLESARVSITPSGALELDPLQQHDAASYRCRVALAGHHQLYRTSDETELRVSAESPTAESPPRFIATPQPITVIEGASATLDCAAVGSPKPLISWLSNGAAIDLSDLDSRFFLAGAGSLRVQSARALDAGAYTCRATNAVDSADHTTQLHVLSAPRVHLPSGPVVVAHSRGDVTLRCDVKGRPQPQVTWLKDGEPLSPNQHDIALIDGTSLRIQGVLPVDAGMFQCFATSGAGAAQAALRLKVLPPDDDNTATAHNKTSHDIFNTLISTPLHPSILDLTNDLDLDLDLDSYDDLDLGETSSAYTPEPSETIDDELQNSTFLHAAKDLDLLGEGNATIVSMPKGLKAVIVKHRFVTLSWEEPEVKNEEVKGYAVVFKVKGSQRERVSRGVPSKHEMNIASLQPNTTYQFTVRAYTEHAVSPPTEVLEATTPSEELLFGPPTNVRAEALGPHAVRVTWSPPSSPAPPNKYTVHYSEAESGREQFQSVDADVGAGSISTVLTGLRAASAYWLRVSANGGAPSQELRVRTPSDVPSAPPANVTAVSTGATSILVRWESPPSRTHRGPLTGFKVRYRPAPAPAHNTASAVQPRRRADSLTTPADARRAELRGLDTATTYQIRVCAINANGSGPFSEWVTATTQRHERDETHVPAQPPPLTTRAGRDWISVWWDPEGGYGDVLVRGYWLGWGLGVPDEHTKELPSQVHSHVIRGLESNSEYVISLRASNALGLGPPVYATVRTRTTAAEGEEFDEEEGDGEEEGDEEEDEDDAPPLIPPVGVKVIMLSGTTAVVYWTDPSLAKGQAASDGRRYVVRYSAATANGNSATAGRARLFNASDLNCMLDDLKPFTQYEFAVKLIKGGRESAWSMLVTNTTLEAAPSSPPRDLRASPAQPAARSVELQWLPPAKPNGIITGYVVMYAVQSGGGGEEWTAVAVVGAGARARVDRLRARTPYLFKVQARNSKGLGPFSTPLAYTTAAETGEGGGLAAATSAWLWASAGGACAVLALAAALALSLCCRRAQPHMSPDTSTYQKSSASAGIKPPDLWIHHDQMELKHLDKSLHSSASKMSAGSVDGPNALVSSTLTLSRAPPAEYEPARHQPHQPPASLDRRHYVPTYVDSVGSCASDDTAVLRASPASATASASATSGCYRCEYKPMTGGGVGVGSMSSMGMNTMGSMSVGGGGMSGMGMSGMSGMGVGCASTCDRRQHVRGHHPDQSTPLLSGMGPMGSPQSSLASLHPPPAPCGSGTCPLGAACSAPTPASVAGSVPGSGGSDIYASAARERGHYVAYEPLGHYTHRDSLSSEGGPSGPPGPTAAPLGSLQRRTGASCAQPLHSFSDTSDHSTPTHSSRSVRESSPYKKSASSSPGHVANRLQLGGTVAHCPSELEPLTPSRSTERLHREMQNLEGLMKDLSAITQQQFHC